MLFFIEKTRLILHLDACTSNDMLSHHMSLAAVFYNTADADGLVGLPHLTGAN